MAVYLTGKTMQYSEAAVAIYGFSGALEALLTLTADLQPAASGPMTAEKQPTLTH